MPELGLGSGLGVGVGFGFGFGFGFGSRTSLGHTRGLRSGKARLLAHVLTRHVLTRSRTTHVVTGYSGGCRKGVGSRACVLAAEGEAVVRGENEVVVGARPRVDLELGVHLGG